MEVVRKYIDFLIYRKILVHVKYIRTVFVIQKNNKNCKKSIKHFWTKSKKYINSANELKCQLTQM